MKQLLLFAIVFAACVCDVIAQDAANTDQLYAPMSADDVRSRVLDWAASQSIADDAAKLEQIGKLWALDADPIPADQLLEKAVQSFALGSQSAKAIVDACQFGRITAPSLESLEAKDVDPFLKNNLAMYAAKFMAQAKMYDDALETFARLDAKQLIDTPSNFFFRGVCEHGLLMKTEGLKTLNTLIADTSDVPVRYRTVAKLMRSDLEALKEKSLGEVAKMMSDAQRRLELGEGGARVQKVEEEIIARLDEIIKKMEQQQGGGGGGGDGQNNSNQSNSAAQDSRVKGSTAPGNVDNKDIGKKAGWGALPPKDQAKAKNVFDRDLPPHYRAALEAYLKKQAERTRKSTSDKK